MAARTTALVGSTGSVSTTSTRKFFNALWRDGGGASLYALPAFIGSGPAITSSRKERSAALRAVGPITARPRSNGSGGNGGRVVARRRAQAEGRVLAATTQQII